MVGYTSSRDGGGADFTIAVDCRRSTVADKLLIFMNIQTIENKAKIDDIEAIMGAKLFKSNHEEFMFNLPSKRGSANDWNMT